MSAAGVFGASFSSQWAFSRTWKKTRRLCCFNDFIGEEEYEEEEIRCCGWKEENVRMASVDGEGGPCTMWIMG